MELTAVTLALPAFVAGILMFLAPCTLPIVPGFLGFISGVSIADVQDERAFAQARRKILRNAIVFVVGFSIVFILMGSLFGLGGLALAKYRPILARIGGVVVLFFGLYMLGVLRLPILRALGSEHRINPMGWFKPGRPLSSFLFGATFAFGWTPCVGPILGSVLLLASSTATIGSGMALLALFSLGLALPFLLIAVGIGSATKYIQALEKRLRVISIVGGVFVTILGVLMVTGKLAVWMSFFYRMFSFIEYDRLLDFL